MKIGMLVAMQNHPNNYQADHHLYWEECKLAELAEPLGFDSLWAVEHHFDNYAMIPDVVQFLTYLAGRTTRIQLGTAVIVLPWHDPVRVAEQIAMLDILSEGRVLLGFGRGAARVEYEGFRIAMDESRERFVEAAEVVVKALKNERFSHQGKYFQIPEMSIRPQPYSDFTGRMYGAAVSPESAEIMAKLGFGVLIIPQRDWDTTAAELERYNAIYRSFGKEPIPPVNLAWVYVDETEEKAMAGARRYMGAYWQSADLHYELSKGAHKNVKGYEFYHQMGQAAKEAGADAVTENFVSFQVAGTPQTCLDKIAFIKSKVNMNHFAAVFKYGGMPIEVAEENMRRFAATVMPALQRDEFTLGRNVASVAAAD
jgi:alkanesulfonate monooxygenase SsuD/methylene tetrahydromethanopterin reductase-like flavin-dependent oxidoreductase (luciferase family)